MYCNAINCHLELGHKNVAKFEDLVRVQKSEQYQRNFKSKNRTHICDIFINPNINYIIGIYVKHKIQK